MTEATEEEHQRLMSVRDDRFAAIQDEDLERILARMKAVLVSTLRAGMDEIGRLPSEGRRASVYVTSASFDPGSWNSRPRLDKVAARMHLDAFAIAALRRLSPAALSFPRRPRIGVRTIDAVWCFQLRRAFLSSVRINGDRLQSRRRQFQSKLT